METTLLLVIAFLILIPCGLLVLGGRLVDGSTQARSARKNRGSRLRRDLAGIEDALVSFFAHSKVAAAVLGVLAAHSSPVSYAALRRETAGVLFRARPREAMQLGAILPALLLAQLVRMSNGGFVLTAAGREAHRRIQAAPTVSSPEFSIHPNRETMLVPSAS
jgi:hypothetical protein